MSGEKTKKPKLVPGLFGSLDKRGNWHPSYVRCTTDELATHRIYKGDACKIVGIHRTRQGDFYIASHKRKKFFASNSIFA